MALVLDPAPLAMLPLRASVVTAIPVTNDTSHQQLEKLVAGIRQVLTDNPLVDQNGCQVRFNNFAESHLEILVIFYLLVEDSTSELTAREAVLFRIMDLVKEAGVQFA